MGKEDYRSRMILGRSAFRPLDLETAAPIIERSRPGDQRSTNGTTAAQVYDEKGRPRNPAKDELCERIRYAQNEILAISGIVEHTPVKQHAADQKHRARADAAAAQRDERGIIGLIASLPRRLLAW